MINLFDSLSYLATLLEAVLGKEEFISRLDKLGYGVDVYDTIRMDIDPTSSKKYAAWILFQLEGGEAAMPRDKEKLQDLLKRFEKAQPRLSQKDLYTYKSIDEVEAAIGQAGSSAEARKVAKAGTIKVADKNGYEIYQATTVAALMKASNHTDWCTTQKSTAEDYIKHRVRFYVVFKDGVKQGAIVFDCGKVTTYHPEQNKHVFELTDPDLEAALGFLSQEDYAKLPTMANIINDPQKAYLYARDVLKGERFPAGDLRTRSEAAIASYPYYAYEYAYNILKGERFPAGEAVIANHPYYAYVYALDVLKGERFPAGDLRTRSEAAIASDPRYAYLYALYVLKGERFPAGDLRTRSEAAIASNSDYAYEYARDVLKLPNAQAKRWGEEYRK